MTGAAAVTSEEITRRVDTSTITPQATITQAIARLDKAGTGALLLCGEDRKLQGLLTDGDVRRAILNGTSLNVPCSSIASQKPLQAAPAISQKEALHLMNSHDVNHLPLVDGDGRITGFVLRKDLVTEKQLELSAVIMAGGYGTRLRPLTEHVPKPMLPLGDRPLLELTIEQLRKAGIRRVNVTTHYLADHIVDHFGNGQSFGVDLNFFTEDHPLGTAGGLKLIDKTDEPMLVLNGDILTDVSYKDFLTYHRSHRADVTVAVRRYEMQVPYGVVECDGPSVRGLKEKPDVSFLVNAGMYLIEPVVFGYIPDGKRFDMPDLIQRLLDEGRSVVSYPILEYWLDIGKLSDYQRAQEDVKNGRLQ